MLIPYFIDLEASGFGRGSYPIEVAVVDDQGDVFCQLIKPLPHWLHWDDSAQALHGISRTTLQQQGVDVETIALAMNQRFAKQVLYTDAWGMDNSWLGLLFDEAGYVPRFRLETVRKLLTEEQAARWFDCKQQIIAEHESVRHRATDDAKILQLTYAAVVHQEPAPKPEDYAKTSAL